MENSIKSDLDSGMPEDWIPNFKVIFRRLESIISSGLNIGAIERMSGLSEQTLHAFLDAKDRTEIGEARRTLNSDGEEDDWVCLYRLESWLNAYDLQRHERARKYTEIETGLIISGLGMDAMEKKRLFHLIGAYGICKTLTLKRLAEKYPMTHETPGCVYVELVDEDRNAGQVYQRISDAMRIHEKVASRGRSLGQRVRNTLRSGDLIVADNANYAFDYGTWRALQDIYDGSEASLLIVSNPTANGFVKKNQEDLGAFLSRARTRHISGNSEADGTAYARAIGYTCEKIIAEAGKIVVKKNETGGMRTLAKAFEDAEQTARAKHRPVDAAMLREAAKINSVFFR